MANAADTAKLPAGTAFSGSRMMEDRFYQKRTTAFVREVVLPGIGPWDCPAIDSARCGFALEVRASPIHRWGVFALEPIPSGRLVIEYTGERIDAAEADRRAFRNNIYLFCVDDETLIDGAIGGSGAEFINHSESPNLEAEIREGRIFFFSVKPIAPGEEITLDYQLG